MVAVVDSEVGLQHPVETGEAEELVILVLHFVDEAGEIVVRRPANV